MNGKKSIHKNQKKKKERKKKIYYEGEELHRTTVVRELLFVIC